MQQLLRPGMFIGILAVKLGSLFGTTSGAKQGDVGSWRAVSLRTQGRGSNETNGTRPLMIARCVRGISCRGHVNDVYRKSEKEIIKGKHIIVQTESRTTSEAIAI